MLTCIVVRVEALVNISDGLVDDRCSFDVLGDLCFTRSHLGQMEAFYAFGNAWDKLFGELGVI
jgi:hypothetical protein